MAIRSMQPLFATTKLNKDEASDFITLGSNRSNYIIPVYFFFEYFLHQDEFNTQ